MATWRKLHTKTVESMDLDEMPDDFTRLLWLMLPLKLCREGRGVDSPAWVRSNIFPLRDDVTLDAVHGAMDWYAAHDMIVRYEVDDRHFFHVPTWTKYQGNTEREAESIYPAPPTTTEPIRPESGVVQESVEGDSCNGQELVMTNSCTDVDVDVDADADADTEAAASAAPRSPPPKKQRKRSKDPPPPAVEHFRAATNRFPAKPLWPGIVEVVGDAEADLTRWEKTCLAWVAMGWKPTNAKGMLQFYSRHEIPGDDGGKHARAGPAKEPAAFDGIREWMAEEEIDGD